MSLCKTLTMFRSSYGRSFGKNPHFTDFYDLQGIINKHYENGNINENGFEILTRINLSGLISSRLLQLENDTRERLVQLIK